MTQATRCRLTRFALGIACLSMLAQDSQRARADAGLSPLSNLSNLSNDAIVDARAPQRGRERLSLPCKTDGRPVQIPMNPFGDEIESVLAGISRLATPEQNQNGGQQMQGGGGKGRGKGETGQRVTCVFRCACQARGSCDEREELVAICRDRVFTFRDAPDCEECFGVADEVCSVNECPLGTGLSKQAINFSCPVL